MLPGTINGCYSLGHTSRVRDVCSPHSRLWHNHHLLRGRGEASRPRSVFAGLSTAKVNRAMCAKSHLLHIIGSVLSPSGTHTSRILTASAPPNPINGEAPRDCFSHHSYFSGRCSVNTSQLTRPIDDISHHRGLSVFSHICTLSDFECKTNYRPFLG